MAEVGTHAQLMRRGGIYAALVRRQSGTVLDQERDLAPHERQQGEGPAADGSQDGGGGGGSKLASGDGEDDSLAQWKQQQRFKVEQDPAAG